MKESEMKFILDTSLLQKWYGDSAEEENKFGYNIIVKYPSAREKLKARFGSDFDVLDKSYYDVLERCNFDLDKYDENINYDYMRSVVLQPVFEAKSLEYEDEHDGYAQGFGDLIMAFNSIC